MTNNGDWSPPTLIDWQNSPYHMKIRGQITLPVTVLALAVSIGAAQGSKSSRLDTYQSTHSTNQDGQKAGTIDSPHIYTMGSITQACGVIPYRGYEGRTGSVSIEMKCNDGAKIHVVQE